MPIGMCRMFAYIGDSNEELMQLYSALKKAAAYDQIATEFKVGFEKHDDGWGYAIAGDDGSLRHYRTSRPIYEDAHTIPRMEGNFSAIFHVRKASDGAAVVPSFAHPFVEDSEGELIFFAHNGSLEKGPLAKELGFKGVAIDSELAAKLFARDGAKCMTLLEKNTKSALNLLIMQIDKVTGRVQVSYKNYYVRKDREGFYRLYLASLPHGKAVYSSTLGVFGINGSAVEGSDLTGL